jgi:processive 1,2-diacylglycerol beta-glucosyltransferase
MPKAKRRTPDLRPGDHPFVLILSCSGGAGHFRAGEALHRTAQAERMPVRTEHRDVLDMTTPLFKRMYGGSYLGMVNHAPEVWGYLYQQSERTPYRKRGLLRLFDRLTYRRYLAALKELRPAAIVCTHFLPYISVSEELRALAEPIPVYAVTTDFDVHQLWVDPIVHRYTVFHEESAWQLQSKGVPPERIRVRGIPVQPEFRTVRNARDVRRELGMPPGSFTILLLSGGFGVGRIADIVQRTASVLGARSQEKFNLVVVCGRNETLRESVAAAQYPGNLSVRVFGFVQNIHDLMDAADLLITKSGGLTSSEALAKALPMIIIDPIPGQESRNADLLVEHGAAWKAINLPHLAYKLSAVLDHRGRLRAARTAARGLARPHAAEDILSDVLTDLSARRATS